jgi:hypothetical protein
MLGRHEVAYTIEAAKQQQFLKHLIKYVSNAITE